MTEKLHEEVISSPANGLTIVRRRDGDRLTLTLGLKTESECVLHWGLRRPNGGWAPPPPSCWPEGTAPAGDMAARTPFHGNGGGEKTVDLKFELPGPSRQLAFVLHFPKENRWLKSGNGDFVVELPRASGVPTPGEALARWLPGDDVLRQDVPLDSGHVLSVGIQTTDDAIRVGLTCDVEWPVALHWGLAWRFRHEWQLPPEQYRPAGTTVFDEQAVRTLFQERDGLRWLELEFRRTADGRLPRGLAFVLFHPEGGWLKSGGQNLYLPLSQDRDARLPTSQLQDLAERIVGAEVEAPSWTLMHRYNLCHDLLGGAEDNEDALALFFAWLRYSATRHLDWQRRFNTKPRELSHAQDRLTARLAGVWRHPGRSPGCRLWARQTLTTLGRGGDGQRVRDEILQIMHRNHIKETSGHFIEEWHQKLHNNTTPDDVVICEAYLAFLRGNGDRPAFYRVLEQGGVTRERLRGFERPIRTDPEFYGDRKDALLGEFSNFLRILKSVHTGADLETAAAAARGRLDNGLRGRLDGLLGLRSGQQDVRKLAGALTAFREDLAKVLAGTQEDGAVRDLLFLDLALEDFLRGAVERQSLSKFGRDELAELVHAALRNVLIAVPSAELAACARHWGKLLAQPRDGKEWALQAKAAADRISRWVQTFTDDVYGRLQPKAEYLGQAFGVEKWVIDLFTEEVIRGGPAFALSLLLRHLDPILRRAAGIGGWQVISPTPAFGRVVLADKLISVQARRFAEPTVLVADVVDGNEEVPEGVTAVLTADAPDLVSHVAVRARNARVLFASCFEREEYERLKGMKGKTLALGVSPGGDVEYVESATPTAEKGQGARRETASRGSTRRADQWVVTRDQFSPEIVGGKSNNLNGLRGKLPDWVRLPTSLALPFGACERVLEDPANRELRERFEGLLARAEADPAQVLPQVRELFLQLNAPAGLQQAVQAAWQQTGLAPVPWEQAWRGIRRVWASKWNERAYLSRRARYVAHDSLLMAVLIQQVVEADYAFVIHTVNPLTGNPDELFAEVVLGLGETLVGNYPGRALGFVCRKADLSLELISYPGKSEGLYGQGVIFRSDSNGEDLEDFAGAGLYDSFLAEEPEHRLLDYTDERLVWDHTFRDGLLRAIAKIGLAVEQTRRSAQDIEGAVAGDQYYVVQTRPQVGLAPR